MQVNLKKDMGNSENPLVINTIDNLPSPKYFQIATAIKKYWWLASYPFYLFLERNELIEVPLSNSIAFCTFSTGNWQTPSSQI